MQNLKHWKGEISVETYVMLKPEAYYEPCQTSEMERFVKIINGSKSSTSFAKRSILEVKYALGSR